MQRKFRPNRRTQREFAVGSPASANRSLGQIDQLPGVFGAVADDGSLRVTQ